MWSLSKSACRRTQWRCWQTRGVRTELLVIYLFGTCTGSATVAVHMNVTCRMGRKPWANHLPTWATEISSSRAGCYYQFVISCEEPSANNRLEISNVYVPTHCTKIDSFKKTYFVLANIRRRTSSWLPLSNSFVHKSNERSATKKPLTWRCEATDLFSVTCCLKLKGQTELVRMRCRSYVSVSSLCVLNNDSVCVPNNTS
jgi:hypothetical protein